MLRSSINVMLYFHSLYIVYFNIYYLEVNKKYVMRKTWRLHKFIDFKIHSASIVKLFVSDKTKIAWMDLLYLLFRNWCYQIVRSMLRKLLLSNSCIININICQVERMLENGITIRYRQNQMIKNKTEIVLNRNCVVASIRSSYPNQTSRNPAKAYWWL